jgi:hypothetical protein
VLMNTKQKRVMLALMAVMLAGLACAGSISTANIRDAWMATDDTGEQKTTVYSPEQDFYCIAVLANAPDETRVKAVWTAVDVMGEDPDTYIYETETTSGDDTLSFSLTFESLWPTGEYKVDLYVNDELAETLIFEVR